MLNKPLTALACLVVGLPLALNPMMAEAVDTTEPVRISVIDSSDADMIAYSYGLLLREIGYNVEFIRIDYSAQIPALETQDIDVAPAIWDSTGWTSITDAVQAGVVVNFGSTGIRIREGWWYPSYVKEACPGLPDWSALQSEACAAIFATVETEPRGRFIDAPADWETDAQMRFDAFGMPLEAISSGSAVALVATMKAAVDQNEPVIGWGFTPHWFFDGVDGEYVELPAFEDACYDDAAWGVNTDATHDCGYASGFIWKLGSGGFGERAPLAARVLHLFQMTTDDVAKATDRAENGGEDIEDVAAEWVEAHRDTWSGWIR